MELLSCIRDLLEFQRKNGGSIQPLMNFTAENCFKRFMPINIFLGVVRRNGAIYIPFFWGHNTLKPGETPEIILDEHTPGYDAYVNGKVVQAGSVREYPFYHPENIPALFPNGFESSLILPVPNFGALLIFSSTQIAMSEELENFLLCVGEVFSSNLANGDHGVKFEIERSEPQPVTLLPLTPRQWAIKDLMLSGLTNGAIAREMNFSESLIRHETIRIYSKLGVNGRKELFAVESEKKEA